MGRGHREGGVVVCGRGRPGRRGQPVGLRGPPPPAGMHRPRRPAPGRQPLPQVSQSDSVASSPAVCGHPWNAGGPH